MDKNSKTNVEFLTDLCQFNSPMVQLFVIDAIAKQSKLISQMTVEQVRAAFGERSFIDPDAWHQTAKLIHKAIEERP